MYVMVHCLAAGPFASFLAMTEPATPPTGAGAPCRGLLFDDFEIGDVHRSQARTVTEADITHFAGLSGDYNPLHTDEEYARGTPFRRRIAHGLLLQSIASGLANQTAIFEGTIAALTEMQIRFRAPVFPGDTIRIELRVSEKEREPALKRGWVRFGTQVLNQRGEVVIDGDWLTLMHRHRPRRRGAHSREDDTP
jgi:acyl dehydratase